MLKVAASKMFFLYIYKGMMDYCHVLKGTGSAGSKLGPAYYISSLKASHYF